MTGAGPTRGLGYGRALVGDREIQVTPPCADRVAYTAETLLASMDWAGVDRAILLQGPFYGEWNRYVLDAIGRYPDRLVGAAHLDPWSPDAREVFETSIASQGFRALKLECSESSGLCGIHPDARLDSPETAWVWDELQRRGMVLVLDLGDVGSRSYQTDGVRAIAEEHTDLRIVIAHLARPAPAVEADPTLWRSWQEQVDLGLLPNVWFDIASLVAFVAGEGYPYPTVERYLRLAVGRIGASKLMWGSDQPGTLLHATYPQHLALARLHTQFLSPDEQAGVLGENALEVFG